MSEEQSSAKRRRLTNTETTRPQGHLSSDVVELEASLQRIGLNLQEKWGEKYAHNFSRYEKLFLKHLNPTFAEHLQTALRGAGWILVLSLPFVLHEYLPTSVTATSITFHGEQVYTSTSVVYFIFTLYLTSGDTISFAQSGIFGTVLAVFNIWMMHGFMPGGYLGDGGPPHAQHRWLTGLLWGIAFVFLVLYLNFDANTKTFALSTFVWYWMAFLNPQETRGFAHNFELNFHGREMTELRIATVGCVLAVVAVLFPYPISAHCKAFTLTKNLVTHMQMCQRDIMRYYSGAGADPMALNIISREIACLRNEVGKMDGLIDATWWECFGMGKMQRQRLMHSKVSSYVSQILLFHVTMLGVCQHEDFDESKDTLRKAMIPGIETIITHNGLLLKCCFVAVHEGHFTQRLIEICQKHKEAAIDAVQDMTKHFCQQRTQCGLFQASWEGAGEHVMAMAFCSTTQYTCKLLEDLSVPSLVEERSWRQGDGLAGLFSPAVLGDPAHIAWTLRNGISITLGFFVGWYGLGHFILSRNADIANTICLLLSNFVGSAMIKNLSRMQGVVLGLVLGNLLYSIFGHCHVGLHIGMMTIIFLGSLFGLFTYFHNSHFSLVGLLCATFGIQSLLRPCVAIGEVDQLGALGSVVNCTVGICIMTLVDVWLCPERASTLAQRSFKSAYEPLIVTMEQLFDAEIAWIPSMGAAIDGIITQAKTLGNEAALEPRYWRHDWPAATFEEAMRCLTVISQSLRSIEDIVVRDRKKCEKMVSALRLKSMVGLRSVLLKHTQLVMEQVSTAIADKSHGDVFLTGLSLRDLSNVQAKSTSASWKPAMLVFMQELNNARLVHARTVETLTDDGLARVCMILVSLRAIFESLDALLCSTSI